MYCSKIHSELGKFDIFTELCFTLSYLIDIHQLGVADDFKSLLFELFVCTRCCKIKQLCYYFLEIKQPQWVLSHPTNDKVQSHRVEKYFGLQTSHTH